jgi:hypothetical protein
LVIFFCVGGAITGASVADDDDGGGDSAFCSEELAFFVACLVLGAMVLQGWYCSVLCVVCMPHTMRRVSAHNIIHTTGAGIVHISMYQPVPTLLLTVAGFTSYLVG